MSYLTFSEILSGHTKVLNHIIISILGGGDDNRRDRQNKSGLGYIVLENEPEGVISVHSSTKADR